MNERRSLAIAPLAIFPAALVFIMAWSLIDGDLRELLVAPLSAMVIAAVGYPIAIVVGWLLMRAFPKLKKASFGTTLLVGLVSAESCFWLLINPIWERGVSNLYSAALVGVSGLATAAALHMLRRKASISTPESSNN
ncbi:MAG: hypothetical protein ACYC4K_03650 [Thiobacillus sp.]